MIEYTTIQGDTWDSVAYKLYGDEKMSVTLMEANLHVLRVSIFSAGVKLSGPDKESETAEDLPPWMR